MTLISPNSPPDVPKEQKRGSFVARRTPLLPGTLLLWFFLAIAPWSWYVWRSWLPIFDLLAIGFPLIALTFLLAVLWVSIRSKSLAGVLPFASMLGLSYMLLASPVSPTPSGIPDQPFRLTSTNLESYWFSQNDFSWHLETHPTDVVVASEMQRSHREELRERFEYHVDDVIIEQQFRQPPSLDDTSYRRFGFPSLGVYSNFPLTLLEDTTGIDDGMPGFRILVDRPDDPLVIYALHVPKPSFRDGLYQVSFSTHREMAEKLAAAVAKEDLPVAVVGDLNMTDRGASYLQFITAGLADGMGRSRTQQTSYKGFWWDLLRLRIDHVLVSKDLCTASPDFARERFTDHVIISVSVGRCSDA